MAARKPIADWSFGPGHGPVSGALNAAIGAGALTAVLHDIGGINPWWGVGAGVASACASAVAIARDHGIQFTADRAMRYRACCWFGAGCWATGQLAQDTWTVRSIATGLLFLGVGTTVAAILGVKQRNAEGVQVAKAVEQEEKLTRAAIAQHWQQRIRTVANVDAVVEGVEVWQTMTGFTLHVILPNTGATLDTVKSKEKELASAANLPPGCNVEVLATNLGRRNILIRVATRNAMSDDQMMPADYTVRTIVDPLSMGVHADRSEASISLRFSCCVMVGQTDSGKSNQLNAITLGAARCSDVFVCAIDLSGGGRFPRPWVRPWVEGRAPRPAIDWVANTPIEAILMTTALIQAINGRTPAYADLMHAENVDYLPVSPQVPEIVLLVDEFATLPSVVKDNVKTISDTGRGAGVRSVCCSLRATSDYIPRGLIVQASERIGMRVVDEAELQHLFDSVWSRGRFDPAATPDRGSGRITTGARSPEPFKGWRMEPHQIDASAVRVAPLRSALDDVTIELVDTVDLVVGKEPKTGDPIIETFENVFTQRWDRTIPVMFPSKKSSQPARPARIRLVAEGATLVAERAEGPSAEDAEADMQRNVEAARAARAAADAEYDTGRTHANAEPAAPDDLEAILTLSPQPKERYRKLLQMWQPTGASRIAEQLAREGYDTVRQTVQGWLSKDEAANLARSTDEGWIWIGPKTH